MRVIIQRVLRSKVIVNKTIERKIALGLLILVGIEDTNNDDDIEWLTSKIIQLRIFNDRASVMNLSVAEVNGELMVVSQFTLHASTKKGNRPSYSKAAKSEIAFLLYQNFVSVLSSKFGKPILTGEFGADMQIELVNDGPVTILIDSKQKE